MKITYNNEKLLETHPELKIPLLKIYVSNDGRTFLEIGDNSLPTVLDRNSTTVIEI